VACLVQQYFPTLSHKRKDFREKKKVTEYKMCVLIFLQLLSENFLILRIKREMIKIYTGFQVKYRYPCNILMKLGFLGRFSKNIKIANFIKIRPVGAELFQTDGQAEMTKT
jgi:hypothetical protein